MYQEDGDPAAALVARLGQEPKLAFFGGLRRQPQPNPTEGSAQTNLGGLGRRCRGCSLAGSPSCPRNNSRVT